MISLRFGSRTRIVLLAGLLFALAALAMLNANSAGAGTPTNQVARVSAGQAAAKISPDLLDSFAKAGPGGKVHYWVILADQADTTNNIPNSQWADKGWYVYNTLTDKADSTQKPLLDKLNTLKQAGSVTSIKSFWIVNFISVTGDLDSARAMAAESAVSLLQLPENGMTYDDAGSGAHFYSPQAADALKSALADIQMASAQANPLAPLLVQPNIEDVHAPEAWALGYDGTGIVLGTMDSGVRWTHEALTGSYRGNVDPPDPLHIHDYDWFDGYNISNTPIDQAGHGSHTMGTALGVSPNPTYGNIGVAKGSTWITVRICGLGGSDQCDGDAIFEGFQWTLAPTRVDGTGPRPDLRPRISSNSWGGGPGTCDPQANLAVQNWVNAGIFPDFANGNAGPNAGTVSEPASGPLAWGTGALVTNVSNWVIANFSSRGPSQCDGTIRPMAVAPGVAICSSVNTSDTAYSCGYSGTSMATPHIAGAVAILLEKNPYLTSAQLMFALTSTAYMSPTWGMVPNNNYGWGLIRIDAALNSIPAGATATPTATGTPPTPTHTATPSPTVCVSNYVISTATATIIPGVQDTGNHCDDCTTDVSFPFPLTFYGTQYDSGKVSSNGSLQFTGESSDPGNRCMPKAAYEATAFLYQNDLCTGPCAPSTCTGCGVFSATLGTAPNRTYLLEWRADLYGTNSSSNSEIIFYENNPNLISMVYGPNSDNGANEVSGVQYGSSGPYTQFSCSMAMLTNGLKVNYTAGPPCPTHTPTPPSTSTSIPTSVATATKTPPPATPTVCNVGFSDVPPGSTFYPYVHCLACLGIINGYPDGTFHPNANVTRGQFSKIVTNSAGFHDPVTTQMFQDVPLNSTFFVYIGRLAGRGYISGYQCGGAGEPCVPPDNLPYFRPGNNATRGQISKIDSNAAGFNDPPHGQQFQDVAPGSTFYTYTFRLVTRQVMSGYQCGGTHEPCIPPDNLPYFRPNNNATRGQTSKIVSNTFFPDCNPPPPTVVKP
jgi:subtilisin family serine protease